MKYFPSFRSAKTIFADAALLLNEGPRVVRVCFLERSSVQLQLQRSFVLLILDFLLIRHGIAHETRKEGRGKTDWNRVGAEYVFR